MAKGANDTPAVNGILIQNEVGYFNNKMCPSLQPTLKINKLSSLT